MTTQNLGTFANELIGASAIPGTKQAWAVGYMSNVGEPDGTLIERSC